MKLKVFTQPSCPHCPAAKEFAEKIKDKIDVEYFDINTANGLTEASMFGVMSTPALVLVDNDENDLERWITDIPTETEFETKIIFHKKENEQFE